MMHLLLKKLYAPLKTHVGGSSVKSTCCSTLGGGKLYLLLKFEILFTMSCRLLLAFAWVLNAPSNTHKREELAANCICLIISLSFQ